MLNKNDLEKGMKCLKKIDEKLEAGKPVKTYSIENGVLTLYEGYGPEIKDFDYFNDAGKIETIVAEYVTEIDTQLSDEDYEGLKNIKIPKVETISEETFDEVYELNVYVANEKQCEMIYQLLSRHQIYLMEKGKGIKLYCGDKLWNPPERPSNEKYFIEDDELIIYEEYGSEIKEGAFADVEDFSSVKADFVTKIGSNAFAGRELTEVELPKIEVVDENAFGDSEEIEFCVENEKQCETIYSSLNDSQRKAIDDRENDEMLLCYGDKKEWFSWGLYDKKNSAIILNKECKHEFSDSEFDDIDNIYVTGEEQRDMVYKLLGRHQIYRMEKGEMKLYCDGKQWNPPERPSSEKYAIEGEMLTIYEEYGPEIKTNAFAGRKDFTSVEAEFVTKIGDRAFAGSGIKWSIRLPKIETIGKDVFDGLTEMRIYVTNKEQCKMIYHLLNRSQQELADEIVEGGEKSVSLYYGNDERWFDWGSYDIKKSVIILDKGSKHKFSSNDFAYINNVYVADEEQRDMVYKALDHYDLYRMEKGKMKLYCDGKKWSPPERPSTEKYSIDGGILTIYKEYGPEIKERAFAGMKRFTSVKAEFVTKIGDQAFDGCEIRYSAQLPKIEVLGKDVFGDIGQLNIFVTNNEQCNMVYQSLNRDQIYKLEQGKIKLYRDGRPWDPPKQPLNKKYAIADGVLTLYEEYGPEIKDFDFDISEVETIVAEYVTKIDIELSNENYKGLKNIKIPKIETISKETFNGVDELNIYVANENQCKMIYKLLSIVQIEIMRRGRGIQLYCNGKGWKLGKERLSNEKYVIESGELTIYERYGSEIKEEAFANAKDFSIVYANYVTKIGNNAFAGCELHKVELCKIEVLGKNAFGDSEIIKFYVENEEQCKMIYSSLNGSQQKAIDDADNDEMLLRYGGGNKKWFSWGSYDKKTDELTLSEKYGKIIKGSNMDDCIETLVAEYVEEISYLDPEIKNLKVPNIKFISPECISDVDELNIYVSNEGQCKMIYKLLSQDQIYKMEKGEGIKLYCNGKQWKPPYAISNGVLTIYKEYGPKIEEGAFAGRQDFSSLKGDFVNEVGAGAFAGCKNLKKIDLPIVRNVRDEAFKDIGDELEIHIFDPYQCGDIYNFSFNDEQRKLADDIDSDKIRFICYNLNNMRWTKKGMFDEKTGTLCDDGLRGCDTDKPDSFAGIKRIKKAIIDSKGKIGDRAFAGCINLNSIEMKQFSTIGENVFDGIENLDIYVTDERQCEKIYSSLNESQRSFSDGKSKSGVIIHYDGGVWKRVKEGVLQIGCTEIKQNEFAGRKDIERVIAKKVGFVENRAFAGCENLESIEIPEIVEIGEEVFAGIKNLDIYVTNEEQCEMIYKSLSRDLIYAMEKGEMKLYYDGKRWDPPKRPLNEKYAISNGVLTIYKEYGPKIEKEAFAGRQDFSSLKGDFVNEVGFGAFAGCKNLKKIDLPIVRNVRDEAFKDIGDELEIHIFDPYQCGDIYNFSFNDEQRKLADDIDSDKIRFICYSLNNMRWTKKGMFDEKTGTLCDDGLRGCNTDKPDSFAGIKRLKNVVANREKEIGYRAFAGCKNLESVEIQNAVKIGDGAFAGCENLESIRMPEIVKIGEEIFTGIKKIDIYVKDEGQCNNIYLSLDYSQQRSVMTCGGINLYCGDKKWMPKMSPNEKLHYENGLVFIHEDYGPEIKEKEFANRKDIKRVVAEHITKIGDKAFAGCTNLERIEIRNIETVGEKIFDGIEKINIICGSKEEEIRRALSKSQTYNDEIKINGTSVMFNEATRKDYEKNKHQGYVYCYRIAGAGDEVKAGVGTGAGDKKVGAGAGNKYKNTVVYRVIASQNKRDNVYILMPNLNVLCTEVAGLLNENRCTEAIEKIKNIQSIIKTYYTTIETARQLGKTRAEKIKKDSDEVKNLFRSPRDVEKNKETLTLYGLQFSWSDVCKGDFVTNFKASIESKCYYLLNCDDFNDANVCVKLTNEVEGLKVVKFVCFKIISNTPKSVNDLIATIKATRLTVKELDSQLQDGLGEPMVMDKASLDAANDSLKKMQAKNNLFENYSKFIETIVIPETQGIGPITFNALLVMGQKDFAKIKMELLRYAYGENNQEKINAFLKELNEAGL